jgi:hypothetical protein
MTDDEEIVIKPDSEYPPWVLELHKPVIGIYHRLLISIAAANKTGIDKDVGDDWS